MQKKMLIYLVLGLLPFAAQAEQAPSESNFLLQEMTLQQLKDASNSRQLGAYGAISVYPSDASSERRAIKEFLYTQRSRFTMMNSKGNESELTDQQFIAFTKIYADRLMPRNQTCRERHNLPLADIYIPSDGIALLNDPTAYYDGPFFRNINNVIGEALWFIPRAVGTTLSTLIIGHQVGEYISPTVIEKTPQPTHVTGGYAAIDTTEKHWNDGCILWGAICKDGMAPQKKEAYTYQKILVFNDDVSIGKMIERFNGCTSKYRPR